MSQEVEDYRREMLEMTERIARVYERRDQEMIAFYSAREGLPVPT